MLKNKPILRFSTAVALWLVFISFSQCGQDAITDEIETAALPSAASSTVGLNTITCNTLVCIQSAMQNAQPGDVIRVAAGTYTGSSSTSGNSQGYFYSGASGTSANPIVIEADDPANLPILQGSSNNSKYVLYLTGSYWIVKDLKFRNGKKGMMLDNSDHTVIQNCEVYDIGEEGIHLRDGTSYAEVTDCYVHDTGQRTVRYGEGIYIGSDKGKWSTFTKECDYNLISNNVIGPEVTAEHIDLKEGSSYNIIEYNVFDGAGMSDLLNGGLSFMDVKGNDNVTRLNCGFQNGNSLLANAYEVHEKQSGWGANNTFVNNHVTFDGGNTSSYVVAVSNGITTTSGGCNVRVPSGNMNSGTVNAASCTSGDTPSDCSLTGGGSNVPPSVSITSPLDESTVDVGTDLTISASAADTDGSIVKVEFYSGTTKLGEDTTAPYSHLETNVPQGSFNLTAKAYDDDNAVTTSSVVTIHIVDPLFTEITAPAYGATFTQGDDIIITANASGGSGGISKVEFYAGTTKLGEDSSAPYSHQQSNVPSGTFNLTTVAIDSDDNEVTSAVVAITIN